MGMYDHIEGKCPFCGAFYSGQSKLFECCSKIYAIGSHVPTINIPTQPIRIELKTKCDKCGQHPIMLIHEGKIIELSRERPTHREGYYSESISPETSRKEYEKQLINLLEQWARTKEDVQENQNPKKNTKNNL